MPFLTYCRCGGTILAFQRLLAKTICKQQTKLASINIPSPPLFSTQLRFFSDDNGNKGGRMSAAVDRMAARQRYLPDKTTWLLRGALSLR